MSMNGIAIDPMILSAAAGLGMAVALAVALVVGLVKWHAAVLDAIKTVFKAIFTFNGFFWVVNLSCMAYSAQNAGYIFGLYETSGFVIGLALDGLIIVFTQTALAAKARGEVRRAGLILLFIVACCLLSTIGNLAHNLHTDISTQTSGVWFGQIVPYVTSLMPLLLIAMAWVADLKINPLSREDPKAYEQSEEKQILFQEIQVKSREKREVLQTRVIALEALRRRNNALRRGKVPGSFRWAWEKALDAGEVIASVSAQLKALFDPQIEEMKRELEELRKEKAEYVTHVEQANARQMIQLQQHLRTFVHEHLEEIRADLSEQNEQYRLALGQQYDQDITLFTQSLNERIDLTLQSAVDTLSHVVLRQGQDDMHKGSQMDNRDGRFLEDKEGERSGKRRLIDPTQMISQIEVEPEVLNRYPKLLSWLSRGARTVSVEEIIEATGHSRKMVQNRLDDSTLKRSRNASLITVKSVVDWLKNAPLPKAKAVSISLGQHDLSDPLQQEPDAYSNGHNGLESLQDLAVMEVPA